MLYRNLPALPTLIALLALLALLGASTTHADGLALVEEGQAEAVIVIPDGAGTRSIERSTAEMLAEHLEMISGAALEVVAEDELTGEQEAMNLVLVGEGERVRELGVSAEELGIAGIRLKTVDNTLVLLGGPREIEGEPGRDGDGLRYAAIELLERLGVRYLWPGELGLVVPARASIEVDELDVTYTPQIRRRGMRWGRFRSRSQTGVDRLDMTRDNWQQGWDRMMGDAPSWTSWQRLGGRMPSFGHAAAGLRNGEDYLESKPEWFALQADGTRDQGGDSRFRLCKSNPELIEHVANDIIQRRNENPDLELVSLGPNDGGSNTGWCLCEDCKALDPDDAPTRTITTFNEPIREGSERRRRERIEHVSLSDRLVYYWRSVAERVVEEHPDLLFGVSAYSVFSHPPIEQQAHPNFLMRYVPGHTDYVEGWKEAGIERMFWRPNILLANRRDGKLRSIVGRLVENMHYFADAGIIQTDFDSINHNWSTLGLSYYATARLLWDPTLERDQIIADFAAHGFGDGAEYIERYVHRVEQLTEAGVTRGFDDEDDYTYTPEVIAELRDLLNRAEAAADDETIAERVAFLRTGLNFTEVHERLDEKSRRAGEGEDVDETLAERLIDLNCLMLRDLMVNHTLAVNVPQIVWGSGTFARYSRIGGRTVTPSDETLLERIDDPDYGLTGREDGLEDMFRASGL